MEFGRSGTVADLATSASVADAGALVAIAGATLRSAQSDKGKSFVFTDDSERERL